MAYAPELLTLLEQTLAPTSYCVGDMLDHGMGDWHAAVLLDNTNHLSSLELLALNARNFAGHTPLDIAYCLNRTSFIERLEANGAEGSQTSKRGALVASSKMITTSICLVSRES